MRDGKRVYTFEDWKEGKIPKPDMSNADISDLPDKLRSVLSAWKATDGDWPQFWRLTGFIDKDTQLKIESEKKKAFLIGAENSAEIRRRKFKKSVQAAPNENERDLVILEIEKAEGWFQSAVEGDSLKQQVLSGQTNPKSVTPEVYNNFLSTRDNLNRDSGYISSIVPQIREETEGGFRYVDFRDNLFYAHANHLYLQKLKDELIYFRPEIKAIAQGFKSLPRTQSSLESILTVLVFSEKHKAENRASVIKKIQAHTHCPTELINSGGDKRCRRIIKYYDDQTDNDRYSENKRK